MKRIEIERTELYTRLYIYNEESRVTAYLYDNRSRLGGVLYPWTNSRSAAAKKEAEEAGLFFTSDKGFGERRVLGGEELSALRSLLNLASPGRGNAVQQVQMSWPESYAYDRNGNRISKTTPWGTIRYEYDAENRLVKKGETVYANDKDGNLLSEKGMRREAYYEYNGRNRMVYSETTDLAERTRSIGFYGYDALGRRTLTGNGLGRTLRTVYDGLSFEIIREGETFLDGSLTAQYAGSAGTRAAGAAGTVTGERYRWIGEGVYGAGAANEEDGYTVTGSLNGARGAALYAKGEAVAASYGGSEGTRSVYLGKDALGSVRTATGGGGALESRYEYDAFGTPYEGDFSGGANLGYTGKPYDSATGLYDYGFRDYMPQAARFTTSDPIRDGNNWFSYVNHDPVNWIDLWGLCGSDRQSSIGQIADAYSGYRMQDEPWKDIPLGSETIGKEGCKVTGASQLVSTITETQITPDEIANYADSNGNLSQDAIIKAVTDNGGSVTTDYWEKQLNAQTLDNIRNGEGTTYIFGRANVGGGIGQHWVVITDYSVGADGTIGYTVNNTSNGDEGRSFTSGFNNDDKKIGTIDRIETYTVK